jgi:hypothetical protein
LLAGFCEMIGEVEEPAEYGYDLLISLLATAGHR